MNARRPPERVLKAHLANQRPQLGVDLWPTFPVARLPPPITAKTSAMRKPLCKRRCRRSKPRYRRKRRPEAWYSGFPSLPPRAAASHLVFRFRKPRARGCGIQLSEAITSDRLVPTNGRARRCSARMDWLSPCRREDRHHLHVPTAALCADEPPMLRHVKRPPETSSPLGDSHKCQ